MMRTARTPTGGHPGDLAVSVGPVNLLGVKVTARGLLSCAEHERRMVLGLGAVTNPALLDCLLGLPARRAREDPVLWAETSVLPEGIVHRSDDGCTVTRLLEPALVVDDVIVPGARCRELLAVQDASLFAGFTRRWVRHQGAGLSDAAVLEAKLVRGRLAGLVRPGDPASRTARLHCSRRVGVAAGGEEVPPVAQAGSEALAPGGTGKRRGVGFSFDVSEAAQRNAVRFWRGDGYCGLSGRVART